MLALQGHAWHHHGTSRGGSTRVLLAWPCRSKPALSACPVGLHLAQVHRKQVLPPPPAHTPPTLPPATEPLFIFDQSNYTAGVTGWIDTYISFPNVWYIVGRDGPTYFW